MCEIVFGLEIVLTMIKQLLPELSGLGMHYLLMPLFAHAN